MDVFHLPSFLFTRALRWTILRIMPTLLEIPFELDPVALRDKAHVASETDVAAEFDALVRRARTVARPRALYSECFVEARENDAVTIGGVVFRSHVLRKNLDKVERVFPYVTTCGREVDDVLSGSGDCLESFWLEVVKTALLTRARDHLAEHLGRRYALGKTATMNPGSGEATMWPIEQQRELFALLGDVEGQTGVELTESFLMIPNKTVSGILFPTDVDFRSCQLCRRAGCPSRAAPFDHALWASMQNQ